MFFIRHEKPLTLAVIQMLPFLFQAHTGHFATLRVDGAIAQSSASRPALTRKTPTDTLAEVNSVILSIGAHTHSPNTRIIRHAEQGARRVESSVCRSLSINLRQSREDARNDTAHLRRLCFIYEGRGLLVRRFPTSL